MRTLVALSLILASAPSLASDPAYVGPWSKRPACADPMVITVTTAEGDDWICSILATQPRAGEWSMKLACASEGREYTTPVRWRVEGGKLHSQGPQINKTPRQWHA